jgi:hypothetical protein
MPDYRREVNAFVGFLNALAMEKKKQRMRQKQQQLIKQFGLRPEIGPKGTSWTSPPEVKSPKAKMLRGKEYYWRGFPETGKFERTGVPAPISFWENLFNEEGIDSTELPQGVTEEDIRYTMQKHNLTREEVLRRLSR